MGQVNSNSRCVKTQTNHNHDILESFHDLKEFPPEIALSILSNLNATDLCLASCVWRDLAEDDTLWKGLCYSRWGYTSIYERIDCQSSSQKRLAYKALYLLLDEASLIFAFRPHQGMKHLIDNDIIYNDPLELAKLLDGTSAFYNKSIQIFLKESWKQLRTDVLDELVHLQNFEGVSLCDCLRKFFKKIHPPEERGEFLDLLVEKFSYRFYECNQFCGFNKENIAVLCYSLLLLSVDLYSPHVKNKMSKREFIRNNRQVLADANRDTLSDFYDDVYLNGHIVPNCKEMVTKKTQRFPFYRPYGAIFEFKPIEIKLSCSC